MTVGSTETQKVATLSNCRYLPQERMSSAGSAKSREEFHMAYRAQGLCHDGSRENPVGVVPILVVESFEQNQAQVTL